jgi:(1->4)-alpha-D-glucan 1-alpha-D-glucosylmutase
MQRYICVHGHFYQPPRENPWLEAIEIQDSAYPYHDWNERISAECYAPNATARILDAQQRIVKIVNNYARISFNIGPTLMAWLEAHDGETYQAILAADAESRRRYGGHGSAIAQVYNHMIMPLASRRDKTTQVLWGLRDFERRFGRPSEGMWLAETAVDLETLEALAEQGVSYTILAPNQAHRVRKLGESAWSDVSGARVDPTRAYRCTLPSGRTIALFFYDGPISRAVAFERLLANGEHFARRLESGFNSTRSWPQLVHIATDGESYGHHHRYGDMALSYALDYIERTGIARLTNYGEYLHKHPPTHEVQIYEDSSWSCAHGIERWRSDCGCNSGGTSWNQRWRAPLREALDWLRDTVAPRYEELAGRLLADPWAARDAYIDVILDRRPASVDAFLARHARAPLDATERVLALKLLELQRQAMLMYTSCGWFFDEISGIETVQVIMYARRAIQLAEELFELPLEAPFLERLARAESNLAEHGDGRRVYEKFVRPAVVDRERLAAHYAVSSLFEAYGPQERIFCYDVAREGYESRESNGARLILGRARFSSTITHEQETMAFGVLQSDDHSFNGGVRALDDASAYATIVGEATRCFDRGDLPGVLALLERHFGESSYSLRDLFRDEQRKVVGVVLDATMQESEQLARQIYERQAPLMGYLKELGQTLPATFRAAAELVLQTDLRRALEDGSAEPAQIEELLAEADRWGVGVDEPGLAYTMRQSLERQIALVRDQIAQGFAPATTLPLLQRISTLIATSRRLPFAVELRDVQNIYYAMAQTIYPEVLVAADRGAPGTQEWAERFAELGAPLNVQADAAARVWALKTASAVAERGQELLARRHIPRASYRLQFGEQFGFADARRLGDYLDELGVSDIYASPVLTPRPGSSHGYDVVDYRSVSATLGGEEGLVALSEALQGRGMGIILDIVPNHMGIGPSNAWWMDVLENGPSSPYARYFDIDWHPAKPELANKLLLPVLEDFYGKVLESGKLQLDFDAEQGAFRLSYYEHQLPVAPRSYGQILAAPLESLRESLGAENPDLQELESILTAINYLPDREETDAERLAERTREKEVIKRRIAALCAQSEPVRESIRETVTLYNGRPGFPQSFDRLDALIDEQPYRLAFWQVAGEEINYRRFFDVNELAAVRMELPEVFDAAHALVLRLLAEGRLIGLRIDHSDGLRDPAGYFRRLQEAYLVARLGAPEDSGTPEEVEQMAAAWLAAAHADGKTGRWPLYVVAEKILAHGEQLPHEWAIYGTTGYEYLNVLGGIFVEQRNRKAIEEVYARFLGERVRFGEIVNVSKKLIMLVSMASEINGLAHRLERIAEQHRDYRDFTLNGLTFALREVIASLAVYRTYLRPGEEVGAHDKAVIARAVAEAKRRNPRTAPAIFDFLRATLTLENLHEFADATAEELLSWVLTFQQLTGPVMAKGVEDTTFYRYNMLLALNEVGGHPERFGASAEEFHQHNLERQAHWPNALLATATHDTKRGEDTRARMVLLSELPAQWEAALARWSTINAAHKRDGEGDPAPSANDEYLFYQTLLGTFPFEALGYASSAPAETTFGEGRDRLPPADAEQTGAATAGAAPAAQGSLLLADAGSAPFDMSPYAERIAAYMAKAIKEAKVHTSWVSARPEYEQAMRDFVCGVLGDAAFLREFMPLAHTVACLGMFNGLAQALLKLTSPGVPDIYQGCELWDLSLVDPDNRRAVDYDARRRLLAELRGRVARAGTGDGSLVPLARELLEQAPDGQIKLYVSWRALELRREREALFAEGGYTPLLAHGEKAEHVVAFARSLADEQAIVVAPRLVATLSGGEARAPVGEAIWGETWLALPEARPGAAYRDCLTHTRLVAERFEGGVGLRMGALFETLPLALLTPLG